MIKRNGVVVKSVPKDGPSVSTDVDDTAPDIFKLFEQSKTILQREIRNLMAESSSKKLSAASARDLTSYLKVLGELVEAEEKRLAAMSDDDLEAIVSGSNAQAQTSKDSAD